MRFIPHTEAEIAQMLRAIGVDSIEALFEMVPKEVSLREDLRVPGPLEESSLLKLMAGKSEENAEPESVCCFLGAGAYDHFVPSVVRTIAERGEFLTSYTPYQPELSQGTLQAQFEYQTMVARLLGLDVSNASMYEGASSLAEACRLAQRHTRRKRVIVSRTVNPQYREVLRTYLGTDAVLEVPYGPQGTTDLARVQEVSTPDVAAIVVQSPNFFGIVESIRPISETAHACGALSIATFTEALAFGLIEPPGNMGADVAAGEGQSLGLPLAFGGPYIGLFAVRSELVKLMPGRLIGMTVDARGNPCYTLTLAAREQHIRRARAGSNICTNEGLCAIMVAVYLSLLGRTGLRRLAMYNHIRTEQLKNRLLGIGGLRLRFNGPTFNEFVVELKEDAEKVASALEAEGLIPGYPLGHHYPELSRCLLVCVTENRTDEDFSRLASGLSRFC